MYVKQLTDENNEEFVPIAGTASTYNSSGLSVDVLFEQVHEYISTLDTGMKEINTWPSDNIPVDNTKYSLGEIRELTISALPADNSKGVLIYFTAAAEGCTLTYPSATKWYGEDAPLAEGGKSYVIVIADDICGINVYNEQSI